MGLFTKYQGLEKAGGITQKSLKFSNDSSFNSQPFIQTPIPGNGTKLSILSPAVASLAQKTTRSATDVVRLSKFMTTPSGIEFIAKQELLSLNAVRTETSGKLNGGIYNPLTTLAQAGVNFAGANFPSLQDQLSFNVGKPRLGYGPAVYFNSQYNQEKYPTNRLAYLHYFTIENNLPDSPDTLFRYDRGPGSVFGIGSTDIKFSTHPDGITPVRTMGPGFIFPKGAPQQPKLYQAQYDSSRKTSYEEDQNTLADFYKMGNPGRVVYSATGVKQAKSLYIPLDFVNARFIYSSDKEPQEDPSNYKDLIRFKIGILDVKTNKTNYTHFRAVIDSFSDSYSSDWSSQTYMGRGEKLYKYNSFDRSINVSFTVAAQSQAEMAGMYQKLNYLASTVTPQYTDKGYMTGNIAKLTVGNYVKDQHGKIDSISFEIPEESPWLISNPENAFNTIINELPFIIKVQMRYTVIHDFRPELVTDIYKNISGENSPNFGSQRYITEKTNKPTGGDESIQFIDDLPEVNVNEKYTQGNAVPLLYTPRESPLPPLSGPSPKNTPSLPDTRMVPGLNPNNSVSNPSSTQSNRTNIPQPKPKLAKPRNIFERLFKNSPTGVVP